MDNQKNGMNDIKQQQKDADFSYFKGPIFNTTPECTISLQEAYALIVSNKFADNTARLRGLTDKKLYTDFKAAEFDYVTFNGKFTSRKDKNLIKLSGLFIIDLDHLGQKALHLLLEKLKKDRVLSPQLIFISPGGNGLKIVVRIDPAIIDCTLQTNIMANIWLAINAYFGVTYPDFIKPNTNGDFIDDAGKDLSRACFLGHDAGAYLNLNFQNVLGQHFIEDYPPLQMKIKDMEISKQSNWNQAYSVNPASTLQQLAKRHLMTRDNHTPTLFRFVCAAKNTGQPIQTILNFIEKNVHISEASSKNDFNILKAMVVDIFDRYNTDSVGAQRQTPLEFNYKILQFRYDKPIKQFVLRSLCLNEVKNVLQDAGFAKRKIGENYIYMEISAS